MNSETQILVKLAYVESTCNTLLQSGDVKEAEPMLHWMASRCVEVIDHLLDNSENAASWSRVAKRCLQRLQDFRWELEEEVDQEEEVSKNKAILYTITVITQMLEDIRAVTNKRVLINDLCDATYHLEKVCFSGKQRVKQPESVYAQAQEYLKRVYQKISEY